MSPENQSQTSASKKHDPVRAAALEALVLVEQGEQADRAIAHVSQEAKFRPLDIRFMMQLVHGTTKMRRRLDHEIKFYLARPSVSLPICRSRSRPSMCGWRCTRRFRCSLTEPSL